MDATAGELDNEHLEGGCNPLSVVIPELSVDFGPPKLWRLSERLLKNYKKNSLKSTKT